METLSRAIDAQPIEYRRATAHINNNERRNRRQQRVQGEPLQATEPTLRAAQRPANQQLQQQQQHQQRLVAI